MPPTSTTTTVTADAARANLFRRRNVFPRARTHSRISRSSWTGVTSFSSKVNDGLLIFERPPKGRARARHVRLDCSKRQPEQLRHFTFGQSRDVAEHHDLALAV